MERKQLKEPSELLETRPCRSAVSLRLVATLSLLAGCHAAHPTRELSVSTTAEHASRAAEAPICVDFGLPGEPSTLRVDTNIRLGERVPTLRPTATSCCYTSRETIRGWVQPALTRAKTCYEHALRRSPDLEGRLEVDFELGWNGRAAVACEGRPAHARGVEDRELVQCVVEAFRAVQGAPPGGCGVRRVRFPIHLSPNRARGRT